MNSSDIPLPPARTVIWEPFLYTARNFFFVEQSLKNLVMNSSDIPLPPARTVSLQQTFIQTFFHLAIDALPLRYLLLPPPLPPPPQTCSTPLGWFDFQLIYELSVLLGSSSHYQETVDNSQSVIVSKQYETGYRETSGRYSITYIPQPTNSHKYHHVVWIYYWPRLLQIHHPNWLVAKCAFVSK